MVGRLVANIKSQVHFGSIRRKMVATLKASGIQPA